MLFMTIYTCQPENRNELFKRVRERVAVPRGIKFIGSWIDFGETRGFSVYETEDIQAIVSLHLYYSDLVKMDTFPVSEVDLAIENISN